MANISKIVAISVLLLLWSVTCVFVSTLVLSDIDSFDHPQTQSFYYQSLKNFQVYDTPFFVNATTTATPNEGLLLESPPPPPCSYELLYKAFRHHNPSDKEKKSDDEEATKEQLPRDCWRPEDEVLQIPVGAIANRHDLDALGAGTKGGVYKAIIQLDEADSTAVCFAALKTEECRLRERTLRGEESNDDDWISCVDPGARSSDKSDMNKEFMGAFLFVAAQKAGADLQGIIPTWGLVVDHENPSTTVGANISYPSVVGAIMPLQKFKTFEAIQNGNLTHLVPKDTVEFAKVMLPVAEALLFMKQLGMSFQDVRNKNLGITTGSSQQDPNGAVVYDNTFLSFLQGTKCGTTNNHHGKNNNYHGNNNNNMVEACNFCRKESLTQKHRYNTETRDSIFGGDCKKFAWHVETLLELDEELYSSEDQDALIASKFRRSKTCQIQDIVERWQAIIKK